MGNAGQESMHEGDRMKKKRQKKRPGRQQRISTENRLAMLAILLVVCLLFSVLLLEGLRLNDRIDAGARRVTELREEIRAEELRTESIEELNDSMLTEESVRQIAKNRLGLVENDELVLKSADEQ